MACVFVWVSAPGTGGVWENFFNQDWRALGTLDKPQERQKDQATKEREYVTSSNGWQDTVRREGR
jgi:hypothetical protein